jgi:hypothetical protein
MISNITAAAVGNALKIYLVPPPGTLKWVVLRNTTGVFPAYNDANSITVFNGSDESYMVDTDGIVNGTLYYYCEFDYDGTDWDASAIVSATPACTYKDQSVDVLSVVRDRIDAGIKNEILIGTLTPKSGGIAVLNAPPMFEETNWPVVTVHVGSDGSGDRSIGDAPFPDVYDPITGLWSESQGWLARVQLNIVGWSKNPDERIALRKALRKIILGNLDVFDSAGIVSIDFSQQDIDDLSSYPAPVYQAMCSFSCEAPAGVVDTIGLITDTNATATAEF